MEENENYFNAPYGILSGLVQFGKGKVREITFGVSRYLDATIHIWSEKKIIVRGQGGLLYKFEGQFSFADELIQHFKQQITK